MHKLNNSHVKISSSDRLYQSEKAIIGLTGSIATGKSTASAYFNKKGIPLIDADKLVKQIYRTSECLEFISNLCPESVISNKIDFKKLRKSFFSKPKIKKEIENFIYARLPIEFNKQVKKLSFNQYDFLIYDVPLLFEKNLQNNLDLTVVVYTSEQDQLERLLKRDHLNLEQAEEMIKHQIPITQKKDLANFILDNSKTIEHLENDIELFLSKILS